MNLGADEIVRQEDTGRAALRALHVSSGGPSTTVFRDDRGGWRVPERPPTAAEIVLRPPKAVYTVDTAEHPEQFSVELPSKGEAFFFRAAVALVWQVQDAVAAAASGLSHPERAYRSQVEKVLRRVAREHEVEDSAQAERAMNDAFADPRPTAQGVVVTRCAIQLSLDSETQKHVAARTRAKRLREARELEHEARKQDGTLRRDEADVTNQLELQETRHRQEVAALNAQHEQRLLQERMQFYADALAGGNSNLIALKLAGSTEDVDDVIALIMNQRNLDFDGARGMLTAMLDQHLVNRSQLQDLLARINALMSDHLTRSPFAITNPGPAPLPSGSEPITIDETPKHQDAIKDVVDVDEDDDEDDDDEKDGAS